MSLILGKGEWVREFLKINWILSIKVVLYTPGAFVLYTYAMFDW